MGMVAYRRRADNRRFRCWHYVLSRRAGRVRGSPARDQYVPLSSGSHDAHLDATADWAKALRSALAGHATTAT
jgi:hypothetical protein